MKKWTLTLFVGLGIGLSSVSAEQIYLRNRPFRGPVVGTGRSTLVGMQAFADAMGLKVTLQGGATFLHPPEVTGTDFGVTDPGGVYVVGRKLESSPGPAGVIMIPLFAAADAAGFRAQANGSTGTIDVTLAPKPVIAVAAEPMVAPGDSSTPAPASAPPDSTAVGTDSGSGEAPKKPVKKGVIPGQDSSLGLKVLTPMAPRRINRPGAAVDIQAQVVPGRYNLVVFGADW